MASILFRLRLVPEDEAEDVRQVLTDSNIPWYETSAGRWGVSFPAIWVRDDIDLPRARELLADYQAKRLKRVLDERENLEPETLVSRICQRPFRTLGVFGFVAVILYFTVLPFFSILSAT